MPADSSIQTLEVKREPSRSIAQRSIAQTHQDKSYRLGRTGGDQKEELNATAGNHGHGNLRRSDGSAPQQADLYEVQRAKPTTSAAVSKVRLRQTATEGQRAAKRVVRPPTVGTRSTTSSLLTAPSSTASASTTPATASSSAPITCFVPPFSSYHHSPHPPLPYHPSPDRRFRVAWRVPDGADYSASGYLGSRRSARSRARSITAWTSPWKVSPWPG